MTIAIDNERTKLAANALDRASTACMAIGVFAPLAAGLLERELTPFVGAAVSFVGWFFAGIVLHLGARRVLGGLKQ